MMELEKEHKELSQIVNDFLSSNRKVILGVFAGILVFGIVVFVTLKIKEKARMDAISKIEKIIYDLEEFKNKENAGPETEKADEKDGDKKSEDKEVTEKEDNAINELKPILAKVSGYAVFRGNTAIAEIYFQRKNYKEALNFYELASKISDKSYNAGISYFNIAACADELGDNEKALRFYEKSSKIEDFPLATRAMFNVGRIYEQLNKKKEAVVAYNKLLEKHPKNEWALLAKSRVIAIENN